MQFVVWLDNSSIRILWSLAVWSQKINGIERESLILWLKQNSIDAHRMRSTIQVWFKSHSFILSPKVCFAFRLITYTCENIVTTCFCEEFRRIEECGFYSLHLHIVSQLVKWINSRKKCLLNSMKMNSSVLCSQTSFMVCCFLFFPFCSMIFYKFVFFLTSKNMLVIFCLFPPLFCCYMNYGFSPGTTICENQ